MVLCPSWFILFGQQKPCAPIRIFFIHSNITQGVVNTKKAVGNQLNPRGTFSAGQETFLGSTYSFFLMSNKNLSFLLSNITQGVVNCKKTRAKSAKPQGYFFAGQETFLGSIYSFLLMRNKKGVLFSSCAQMSS